MPFHFYSKKDLSCWELVIKRFLVKYVQSKGKKRELGWFPGSYAKILGPGGGSRQSSSRTTPIPFDDLIMPTTIAPIYTDSTKGRDWTGRTSKMVSIEFFVPYYFDLFQLSK